MTPSRILSLLPFSLSLACTGAAGGDDADQDAPGQPEPATPAALTACWVETGRSSVAGFGEFTASGILLRHESGDLVLLDGGNSSAFAEEIEVYEGDDRLFMEAVVGQLAPLVPLPAVLADMGYDAVDLGRFVASHVHVDHVGGLMDLPDLPVLMAPAEVELLLRGLDEVLFEVVPAHAERIAPVVQPLELSGPPAYGFEASADLFGDGTAVVVPLSGHTPGSVGVVLTLADGRRLFHVGDAVSSLAQLEQDVGKTWPMDRTDSDPDEALAAVHALHMLAAEDPDLEILPAHDRPAWSAIFGEPGACAGAAP